MMIMRLVWHCCPLCIRGSGLVNDILSLDSAPVWPECDLGYHV